jgi:hypothetical protein
MSCLVEDPSMYREEFLPEMDQEVTLEGVWAYPPHPWSREEATPGNRSTSYADQPCPHPKE